jgi:F0F1-type ATP synthase delta subunit
VPASGLKAAHDFLRLGAYNKRIKDIENVLERFRTAAKTRRRMTAW